MVPPHTYVKISSRCTAEYTGWRRGPVGRYRWSRRHLIGRLESLTYRFARGGKRTRSLRQARPRQRLARWPRTKEKNGNSPFRFPGALGIDGPPSHPPTASGSSVGAWKRTYCKLRMPRRERSMWAHHPAATLPPCLLRA